MRETKRQQLGTALLMIIFAAQGAKSQTQIDLRTQSKTVDFRGAASTSPLQTGAALPAVCAVGAMYFLTTAPAGANLYACATTNTWALQSGGSQGTSFETNGVPAASGSTINLETGPGLTYLAGDTGSILNVQASVDTALVETHAGELSGASLLCSSLSGSATSYSCAMQPTATVYTTGMTLHWRPDVTAAGGVTTLNVDTLGTVPITGADGLTNPLSTDILAGHLYDIWYDGSSFRLPGAGSSGGTTAPVAAVNYFVTAQPAVTVSSTGNTLLAQTGSLPALPAGGCFGYYFEVFPSGSNWINSQPDIWYGTAPGTTGSTLYVTGAAPAMAATPFSQSGRICNYSGSQTSQIMTGYPILQQTAGGYAGQASGDQTASNANLQIGLTWSSNGSAFNVILIEFHVWSEGW